MSRWKYIQIYVHRDLIGLDILTETWQYYFVCRRDFNWSQEGPGFLTL
jgi:hypothetical protein